jgi:hypothetical protein
MIAISFGLGFGINDLANADSTAPSGTSIPIKKGGTGATDKTNALKNLLPDLDGNNGKVLGLNSSNEPTWLDNAVLPDYSAADSGKVLEIDNSGTPAWTSPDERWSRVIALSANANIVIDLGDGDTLKIDNAKVTDNVTLTVSQTRTVTISGFTSGGQTVSSRVVQSAGVARYITAPQAQVTMMDIGISSDKFKQFHLSMWHNHNNNDSGNMWRIQ